MATLLTKLQLIEEYIFKIKQIKLRKKTE